MLQSSSVLFGDAEANIPKCSSCGQFVHPRKSYQNCPLYNQNTGIIIDHVEAQSFIDNLIPIKSCKCGSTSHLRISYNSCPLNKRLTKNSQKIKSNLSKILLIQSIQIYK